MSRVGSTVKLQSFEAISNIALTSCSRAQTSRSRSSKDSVIKRVEGREHCTGSASATNTSGEAIEDHFVGWLLSASRCRRQSFNRISCQTSGVFSRQRYHDHASSRRLISTRVHLNDVAAIAIDGAIDEQSPIAVYRPGSTKEQDVGIPANSNHEAYDEGRRARQLSLRRIGARRHTLVRPHEKLVVSPRDDNARLPGVFPDKSVTHVSHCLPAGNKLQHDTGGPECQYEPFQVSSVTDSTNTTTPLPDRELPEEAEDVSVSRFELGASGTPAHAAHPPGPRSRRDGTYDNDELQLITSTSSHDKSIERPGSRSCYTPFIQSDEDGTPNTQTTLSQQPSTFADLQAEQSHTDEELIEMSKQILRREPLRLVDYKDAVDIYGGALLRPESEARQQLHLPLAPRLTLTAEQEDRIYRSSEAIAQPTETRHIKSLEELRSVLEQKPGSVAQKVIWRLFASLGDSGPEYLTSTESQHLFTHLCFSEYRGSSHYKDLVLDLFEQRVRANVYLTKNQWLRAILLVGASDRQVKTKHVIDSLRMWMRMEEYSVPADGRTFNVLIQIALRAGRYALADALIDEVRARDLRKDRYLLLSLIYYAGMRHDGDAVRAAFNDFVNAREIVDTSVMNAVIKSLCESDEGDAAEHVLANMKDLHAQKFPAEYPKVWQDRKRLQVLLNRLSRDFDASRQREASSFFGSNMAYKEKHEALQQMTPIHPDGTTYRTLIGHHALRSGKADRMFRLIEEMRSIGIQVTGSTYQKIFKGFQLWGDQKNLGWTAERLEKVWSDFVHALPAHAYSPNQRMANHDDYEEDHHQHDSDVEDRQLSVHDQPLFFTESIAQKILRAFEIQCGQSRMQRVWTEILARWRTISPDEQRKLERLMENLTLRGSVRQPRKAPLTRKLNT